MNRPETFRILHPFGPFVNGPYENTQGLACLKWKLISLGKVCQGNSVRPAASAFRTSRNAAEKKHEQEKAPAGQRSAGAEG